MWAEISNVIRVTDPTPELRAWCEEHLLVKNPDYDTKLRLGLWLGRTPKVLRLYEVVGRELRLPFGVIHEVWPMIRDCAVTNFPPPRPVDYGGTDVPLYDYQQAAVDEMYRAKYGILQSLAGSGKTQMMLALIKRWGRPALWLTHTYDLLRQSMERAKLYMDPGLMGTITEGKVDIGSGVTFATVQTMSRIDLTAYRDMWDVVVTDECFPGQTMVETRDGEKRIDRIEAGDEVLTLVSPGQTGYRKVTHLFSHAPRDMMTVRVTDLGLISCTPNHPFLTRDGYKRADRLSTMDEVYCADGKWRGVHYSVWCLPTMDGTYNGVCRDGLVYNIEVEETHNYFAQGVNVHNCHHVAGSPTKVTQFYKVLNSLNARHKYGASATVHRADGLVAATHAILGPTMYAVPDSAVADRVMRVAVRPVDTGVTESYEYMNTDGTVNYTQLVNCLAEEPSRNELILSVLQNNAGQPSLILSHRLEHLRRLMESLPDGMREQAVMVSGSMTSKTGKAEREQALSDMREGKKTYLFASYSLAKEGLDIPRLTRLYLTTPAKDEAVVIQAVGRIARTCPGKADPVAYDFVDRGIGFCDRAYRARKHHYRKCNCMICDF